MRGKVAMSDIRQWLEELGLESAKARLEELVATFPV